MENSCENNIEPKNFKEKLKTMSFWKPIISVSIGGLTGYLYYAFVGCSSGSCGITSNPISSILVGSMLGYLITNRPCQSC